MSVKCSGYARDPAKVEDQVRFLTWTLMNNMACECDGFARQSSKLLDKVRFLGELLSVNGAGGEDRIKRTQPHIRS